MGKSLLAFMLLGISIIFDAYALDKYGNMPGNPESEKDALSRAIAQDPLKNTKQTKALKSQNFDGKTYKAIKLEGGMQFHPSCELEASRDGIKSEDFKKSMDTLMSGMMDRVLRCMKEYPEMKDWLKQSISQFRRQVIRCDPPKGKKGLIEIYGTDYEAYNDGSNVTVSNNWLKKAIKGGYDTTASTIFHELLHSTKCNNRHDHNEIEKIPATVYESTKKADCNYNVSMDRVTIVQSLCMGGNLVSSSKPAIEILADRMNMCGNNRGCRNLFTERGNNFTFFTKLMGTDSPNEDISDAAANKLCERIKDDGMCLHFRNTQGPTITAANPKIKAVNERLQVRLNELLPGVSNKFPMDYLALYPDLQKRFDALKDNTCFKRNFHIPANKPNEVNFLRFVNSPRTVPDSTWKGSNDSIPEHFRNISRDYHKWILRSKPDSECAADEKESQAILTELADTLSKKHASTHWGLRQLMATDDKHQYPRVKELRDPNSDLTKLLGKDLVRDYLKTMDTLHFESPHFNCKAAGLAPFRVMAGESDKSDPLCEE